MAKPDPIESLAVGLAADVKAKKTPKAKAAAAGAEAKEEALAAGSPPADANALETVVTDKVEEATTTTEPTPPAPGEDAETVFDRRLDRLQVLVDESEFETGTAFGDLRDVILDLFRHRPKLWSAMSKSEQQDTARTVEAAAKRIITKVVLVVAQEDSDAIEATFLGNFTVKGESVEAKLKIDGLDNDLLGDIFKFAGHRVMVVSADDKRFMSARRDVPVQEDQLGMTFAGDARPSEAAPAAPAEVSDEQLADGDGSESGVDKAKSDATAGDDWGVFDTSEQEWLETPPVGDEPDAWAANSGSAARMTHEEASRWAKEYDAGKDTVVPRQLGDVDPEERTHDETSAINDSE